MYIKRKLNDGLTTFKNLRYVKKSGVKTFHRFLATVGVGGNVGDVKRRFEHLFAVLKRDKRVELLYTSLILKNPPFGFINQDDFFNSIIVLKTSMQPKLFLDYLMRLEKKFARKRSFANAPRTLDLDIIFFDDRVIKTQKLYIPHPKWFERESVLIPLMDIYR
ncbi:MAG: 2-amino-4-hydroxy-6-hydroxymethyldihydropteridine diphosphokinase [Sulfurimonas sp. RIFOXYD12_FULL_33_39]|uniref:2-amino-4-hydroxy-6- hydroxymethyldihydropteridine diphosphokinase n=1 Tax=unclassified Sulfurimonas TaxID=2623549 RepID=UPI0008D0877F|nr:MULTISPECIES: 2-amino-4-hydroxy-6-hydroxymethyldihydropteridine diphosphokinase [unclassified Sulfurimonas]OHE05686.1 MAG: 2-amino-4-hydroxy-6-hydroxymethyldihydropteridine diphosphokinase [Sulfurimonas sp. RIFCSPLOWO2_12_FULL_34_6]OHE10644.1 MAG: 2-amino-4-hydroxy-6-hydroxymethyldihydropteridine diphosphokinase [Sulfurimonas sp. RIFOXYD12_FULL_33_39]OHE13157.1 MAG: 2-amino-4-hydroxy-6-hydroxymethyldihydropteridine diphosphokinase [Sulfurimonas sp. RIFOXYD2_FULL_34_21]DAB27722.1 MAG TPA: 2-a